LPLKLAKVIGLGNGKGFEHGKPEQEGTRYFPSGMGYPFDSFYFLEYIHHRFF